MPVITVISPKGGSGKSTVTMGIGIWASKIRPDQSVLLIDGDLVVMTIQFKMCKNPRATLADVLRGAVPIKEAVHRCDLEDPKTHRALYSNLGILPAARRKKGQKRRGSFLPPMHDDYPSLMQVARRFDDMMMELRKTFSLILIDTPASRGYEHIILAGAGDGIIYVTDPAHETVEATSNTARDLEKLIGARSLGVVLNRLRAGADKNSWLKEASKIAPVLAVVPKDELVDNTFERDIPVVAEYADCPASQAMKELTLKLLEMKLNPTELTPKLERALWGLAKSIKPGLKRVKKISLPA